MMTVSMLHYKFNIAINIVPVQNAGVFLTRKPARMPCVVGDILHCRQICLCTISVCEY